MAIRVTRNAAGNCLTFLGQTNPVYFNACLSAEIIDTDYVNVINDISSFAQSDKSYEFYRVHFSEWEGEDGATFASAQEVVDYINTVGNVLGVESTNEAIGGTVQTVLNTDPAIHADGDYGRVDPTGLEPGWYFRNSSNPANKINWYLMYNGNSQYSMTASSLEGGYALVTLNSIAEAPYFNYYTNRKNDGQDHSWYRSRVTYRVDSATLAGLTAGETYLLYWGTVDAAIFPTVTRVETTNEAFTTVGPQDADESIMFGSLSTATNYPEGTYDFIADTFGYINSGNNIQYQLEAVPRSDADPTVVIDFHRDPTNTTILVSNGDAFAVNSIKATVNSLGLIDILQHGDDGEAIYTNILPQNVTITGSSPATTANAVVNHLNGLFTVTPTVGGGVDEISVIPTLDGQNLGISDLELREGSDPIGDGIWAVSGTSGHDARMYTLDHRINQIGEYYTVRVKGAGRFILGLARHDEDVAALDNNSGTPHSGIQWGNAFYNYGTYTAPWTTYGSQSGLVYGPGWTGGDQTKWMRYNTVLQDNLRVNGTGALFKVGFTNDGYIGVWYFDEGRSNTWIMTARGTQIQTEDDYMLVVKLWDGSMQLMPNPQVNLLEESAPTLNWRYIESPDGNFEYPLFATAEEANYVDTQNGGSGNSHAHVYADDTVPGTNWYMPDTDGAYASVTMTGTEAPTDNANTAYVEIPTQDDSNFIPSAFTDATITINELASLNYQVAPQDVSYVTTISSSWSGFTFIDGYTVFGFAPEVTGDNVANPSDSYDITVTRTNSFGSSTGTLTVVVNNLTQPVVNTGNWTLSTGTMTAGVLQADSTATLGVTLSEGQRLIIPKEWVDSVLDMNARGAGEEIMIGSLASGADLTDVAYTDFDGVIRWYGSSSTGSHGITLFDELSPITQSDYFTNSGASVYDYGIEYSDGKLHLIACNVNSLNTEPSVENGGSFTRSMYVGDLAGPITITLGTNGGATLDLNGVDDLDKIIIPAPQNWIQVQHVQGGGHELEFRLSGQTTFSSAMPELAAGTTYRFLMGDNWFSDQTTDTHLTANDILKFTSDGATEYTTGITRVGTVGINGSYVEFAVPSDVPELDWYNDQQGIGTATDVTISGSTATSIITSWNKALDFSGSAERAAQVTPSSGYNALRMAHFSGTVAANSTPGFTSDQSSARPWATAVVFRSDRHNSNQHIWNSGEGTGSDDDNIYLRQDSLGNLYFGWGRSGSLNECSLGNVSSTTGWHGVYIAHDGTRLSGSNATASNLSDAFSIRRMGSEWAQPFGTLGAELSTSGNWVTTGGRMDRRVDGDFTIGGRGSNRSFHGKVAAMTVTGLQRGVAMPDDAEIEMMITDPDKWISTYREGQFFRRSGYSTAIAWDSASLGSRAQGVQMWLMGDGTNDSYSNMIRNRVHPTDQNYTKLNMISMVSNDIQTVNIPGLT